MSPWERGPGSQGGRNRLLRGLTIVGLDDTTEVLLAANSTLQLRSEGLIEDFVLHAQPPMWAQCVVIGGQGCFDVVELGEAEADKVVQTFPLMGFDPRFRERIRAGRLERYSGTSHAFRFPEGLELVGKLAVTIMNQKARFHSHVVQPHAGVTCLLHNPVPIGMVGRWAAVHLAAAQMDEDEYAAVKTPRRA